jgi:hypothetical protein
MRWGIRAIVGGSFGEIFFGNCVMLGIPCLRASQEDLEWLQKAIGREPQTPVQVDVEKQEVRFGDRVIKATVPDGPRNQLVAGTWDSTAVLLEAGAGIEATGSYRTLRDIDSAYSRPVPPGRRCQVSGRVVATLQRTVVITGEEAGFRSGSCLMIAHRGCISTSQARASRGLSANRKTCRQVFVCPPGWIWVR